MVQVDVIWSYAFGATFAAAASEQLVDEEKPFDNKIFTYLLLFLAVLFAPSGLYLLWQFPNWETMQVARTYEDIPAWLVTGFAITNITQGIIGYWIGYRMVRRGNRYGAHVNWMVAWILFWSFLVIGWDTSGWQRFLYDPTMAGGAPWEPGKHMGPWFFTGKVFRTLVGMAIPIGPAMALPIAKWIRWGAGEKAPGTVKILLLCLIGTFGIALGLAVLHGLLVFGIRDLTGSVLAAYLIGEPLFWGLLWFLLLKRGRPLYYYITQLTGRRL